MRLMPCPRSITAVAGITLLLASLVDAHEIPIAFATHGGDAWAFSKTIDVIVPENRCDHVAITSPAETDIFEPVNGRVHARLALRPGGNIIQAECYEHGIARGAARQSWEVRLRNEPTPSIKVSETGAGLALDGSASTPAAVDGSAIVQYEWLARRRGNPAPLAGLPAHGATIELPPSAPDGEYYVTLRVTDADHRTADATAMLRSEGGRLHALDPANAHAAWIDRAVVYGVVPQLFGTHGLGDVTAQLDRLSALGITALWLSPITDSPPGDFGYAVTDYFHTRPGLGGAAQLRELVEAAHARGMRVIMDFVPNHLSDHAFYFVDTVAYARASPYYDFFVRNEAGDAEHYFDWSNLENLNYANPEVQNLVIAAFAYWVREFDVDGFRVDAAWGPRQRAPDFWPRWRAELKRIKPDLLLLAEASVRDPYYGQHGFEAAYDWTDKLGEWAWHSAFDDPADVARRLRAAIASSSSQTLAFRFIENNDTGARFVARYGEPRTRVAAAMLLTLPGIPSLYTGQEVGATYEPYKRTTPIAWDDRRDLKNWYRRLISLRQANAALRSTDIRLVDVAPEQNVLAYLRHSASPQQDVLVVLNFGDSPSRVVLGGDTAQMIGHRGLVDLLTGRDIALKKATLEVAPYSVSILTLD